MGVGFLTQLPERARGVSHSHCELLALERDLKTEEDMVVTWENKSLAAIRDAVAGMRQYDVNHWEYNSTAFVSQFCHVGGRAHK